MQFVVEFASDIDVEKIVKQVKPIPKFQKIKSRVLYPPSSVFQSHRRSDHESTVERRKSNEEIPKSKARRFVETYQLSVNMKKFNLFYTSLPKYIQIATSATN